jgi:hypothetical protein
LDGTPGALAPRRTTPPHDGRQGGHFQDIPEGGESRMLHRCAFCNETIQQVEFDFGDVHVVDDEYWHAECYAEYFDEPMDEESEVLEGV